MLRISSKLLTALALPELTYNIASGILSGSVDGHSISASAGSGGRAGTKTAGALEWWLANNPFATSVKLPGDKSHSGGPLPIGLYRLALHETTKNWLRLIPENPMQMQNRDGMAIHGRGKRGSDGCIVPTDFKVVTQLCMLVKKRKEAGGRAVRLKVLAQGQDLDRQIKAVFTTA